jgi:hypothetical protein
MESIGCNAGAIYSRYLFCCSRFGVEGASVSLPAPAAAVERSSDLRATAAAGVAQATAPRPTERALIVAFFFWLAGRSRAILNSWLLQVCNPANGANASRDQGRSSDFSLFFG